MRFMSFDWYSHSILTVRHVEEKILKTLHQIINDDIAFYFYCPEPFCKNVMKHLGYKN